MSSLENYRITFCRQDVENWAAFSGDYNPIHFDLERVHKLGLEQLVVHGMLGIMPVKNMLTKQFGSSDSNDWLVFKGFFSKPIPQDQSLPVSTTIRKGKLRFNVSDVTGEHEFIKGHFAGSQNPLEEYIEADVVLNTEQVSQNYIALSKQYYGADLPFWVLLDNLVFADFVNTKVQPLKTIINPEDKDPTKIEDSEETIMHLSHTVSFDAAFVAALSLDELISQGLSYQVLEPELIRSEGQTVCSLTIRVSVGDRQCMLVQIKLIVKQPVYEAL